MIRPIDPEPGPRPRLPINAQTWESLAMLHWPVSTAQVQTLLPEGLITDEHEGQSWLGVVPFAMSAVRVPPLPALGGLARFPELNVRVYAHDLEGNRGVWFLGLWCSSPLFIGAAHALGLPYHRAEGETARRDAGAGGRGELRYRFTGIAPAGIEFRATLSEATGRGTVDASLGLEAWLTARWNMFSLRAGRLWRYPVHHEPWRLRLAEAEKLHTDAPARFGFDAPERPALMHIADPVHALVSPPRVCPRP